MPDERGRSMKYGGVKITIYCAGNMTNDHIQCA